MADFHRLQFNLLGNDLESMFFPSAIIVVEGPTDQEYLDRVFQLRFPGRRVTVLRPEKDVKEKVNSLRQAFGDLRKSPFCNRLFVVVDSIHQQGLRRDLEGMGVPSGNIVSWTQNGIEYVYPEQLVADVFACNKDDTCRLRIEGDRVFIDNEFRKKRELQREIVRHLSGNTVLPRELEAFIDKVAAEIG